MRRSLRHLLRLAKIAVVLARCDALEVLERLHIAPALTTLVRLGRRRRAGRLGLRMARAAESLGPVFIKLGQALSTRADLIGQETADDLAALRDRLPPFAAEQARAIVAAELGAPLESLFSRFDDQPVAAASIAQVHFARTSDGRDVAVKVLRPGIEARFARDVDLLDWLAALVERTQPQWRRLRPVDSVRTFADMVAVEMDLRLEAAAAAELAENFADDPDYVVPAVDWQRTARRVLTTERVKGTPLSDRARLIGDGHDPERVLTIAARALFNQVFRDGFFHGDPHPGNLFVTPEGRVAVVDFGIMGRLDRQSRRYLAEMLIGFLAGDYARVAEVHFRAGYVPSDKSIGAFTQACRSIGAPIIGRPANEISLGRLLGQLFHITETFGMQTQPHLLLLQKVLVVAEGVGRELEPNANMWQLAQPLVEDWVADNLGPEASFRDAVTTLADTAQRLPRLVREAEQLLERAAARERAGAGGEARAPTPVSPGALMATVAALVALLVVLAL